MGIFDRLRGTSGGAVTVTVTPCDAGPGDEVSVAVDIHEQLDPRARTVLAGIGCTGHYKVRERDRRSDGRTVTREVWRSVELHRDEQPLDLRHGRQVATFTLPTGAPPSSPGAVSWEAWGRVDRERGIDVVETVPVAVRVALDPEGVGRGVDRTADGLTLRDLPVTVRQGETLRGTVLIDLPKTVPARSTLVRLHRRVTWCSARHPVEDLGDSLLGGLLRGGSDLVEDEQVAEVVLAGEATYEPGQRQQLSFAVDVPAAGATTAHPHAQVDWRVEAVLDRRMRSDRSVESPVVVR